MTLMFGTRLENRRRELIRWLRSPGRQQVLRSLGYLLWGGVVSAAALAEHPMPLALGLVCGAPPGWPGLLVALGAAMGYGLFWGAAGVQCIVWLLLMYLAVLLLGQGELVRDAPLLLPALAGLIVSATGVAFLFRMGEGAPVSVYLLRVGLAMGSVWLFRRQRDVLTDALTGSVLVLSLAGIGLPLIVNPGIAAGAALSVSGGFPMALLAGLALDLSRITAVPMSAVLGAACLLRMVAPGQRWLRYAAPAVVFLPICALTGAEFAPCLALVLGGMAGAVLPASPPVGRRGETAVAQVRLELASGVLMQMEQALLDMPEPEIDVDALWEETFHEACGSCPARHGCTAKEELSRENLLRQEELPGSCKKSRRLMDALRRGQSQLRAIRGEHLRQKEARYALVIQYRALATYLQELSDELIRREKPTRLRYSPRITAKTRGRETVNGDRCAWFAGSRGLYYVLLCDGMGTGADAAQASGQGMQLLRRSLEAGLPPEYALGCLNSMCILTRQSGLTTVDLAQLRLDSGQVTLYKWGAAPSMLLDSGGFHPVGAGSAPPGLWAEGSGPYVERLSLRQGEVLILVSDGVNPDVLRNLEPPEPGITAEQLAGRILAVPGDDPTDDATAILIRLPRQA